MEKMSEYTSICGKDGNDSIVITKNDLYNIFVWYKYCELDSMADCVDEVFKQNEFQECLKLQGATIMAGEGINLRCPDYQHSQEEITAFLNINLECLAEKIKADITAHADKEIWRIEQAFIGKNREDDLMNKLNEKIAEHDLKEYLEREKKRMK